MLSTSLLSTSIAKSYFEKLRKLRSAHQVERKSVACLLRAVSIGLVPDINNSSIIFDRLRG